MDEYEDDKLVTICARFEPPAVVYPIRLEPDHFLCKEYVHNLPFYKTFREPFDWKTEVVVDKVGKFCIELKKAEKLPEDDCSDCSLPENPLVGNPLLSEMLSDAKEVIVK